MKKIVIFMLALAGLTGCPDGKNRTANTNYAYSAANGCINCGFNQAVFSQAVTSEIPQAQLTINLTGDANQLNLWARNSQNPIFTYQGPIGVNGTLQVNSPLPFGYCQLPVGQYTVRTIQAGLYNVGVFHVPQVEIVGPARIIVALGDGVILTNGNGIITGFSALFIGIQGSSIMNGWNTGLTQDVGLAGCGDTVGVQF
jgi:hypothetical protein